MKCEGATRCGAGGTAAVGAFLLSTEIATKQPPTLYERITSGKAAKPFRQPFTTKGMLTPYEAANGQQLKLPFKVRMTRAVEHLDRVAATAGVVLETALAAKAIYEGDYVEAAKHTGFGFAIGIAPATGPGAPIIAGAVTVFGVGEYVHNLYLQDMVATHELANRELAIQVFTRRGQQMHARTMGFVSERNALEAALSGSNSLPPCPCESHP